MLRVIKPEFNVHSEDFDSDFTIEFNVKHPYLFDKLPTQAQNYEIETSEFIEDYAQKCFEEIKRLNYKWIEDWVFAGRMGGWYVLVCTGKNIDLITKNQLLNLQAIVEHYYDNCEMKLIEKYN